MKAFVIYTAARLGLFVLTWAVIVLGFYLIGEDDAALRLWPFVGAVVISSVASVYLLRPQRERFAAVIERRVSGASRRLEQSRSKEDEKGS